MTSEGNWKIQYINLVKQLSLPDLFVELRKLENSIRNLHRSNDELKAYHESGEEQDGSWILGIVDENKQVIVKQTEQARIVKERILELEEYAKGATMEDTTEEVMLNGHAKIDHGADEQVRKDQLDADGEGPGIHL
jgi:hypothetical protein